jgi:integrase
MARSWASAPPKYRHYRPKRLAVVRLNGKDIYLGAYDSPESWEKYHRLIAEWVADPAATSQFRVANQPSATQSPAISINEMLLAYWEHVTAYYRHGDRPSKEVACLKYALRPLKALYGSTPARDFGPKSLKAVRQHLIEQDICRNQINARIYRIRRAFRWAVSEELIPASVYESLKAVTGLQRGRSAARESEPVKPVPVQQAHAVLPLVAPQISTMIQLQLVTGMRPGEVVIMRPADIEQTGQTWIYRPSEHKTEYLGIEKLIPLGPQAQQLIRPFLDRSPEQFLFSPVEAEAWRNETRSVLRNPDRKTPIYPSELRQREKRKQKSRQRLAKRPKRDRYDVDAYRRAITYGIEKAKRAGISVQHWHPHQLRHTRATEIRKRYGIEGAQVALGHQSADVTQIYAERNLALAMRIAQEIG